MADKTLKILLTIIAVNLTIQTAKTIGFIPSAQAEVAGMSYRELERDRDFERAVESIIEDCEVAGYADDGGYLCSSDIDC